MKYGQFTAKYDRGFDEYDIPGRSVCRDYLESIINAGLSESRITVRAYDIPGKNRTEVKIVERSYLNDWGVKFGESCITEVYWIPRETLDKLNIIPEHNTYFWIEIWQNGKRKA